MLQTNLLPHGHADLVTHVVYDFYGERIATCSADQKIKLFRKNHEGQWEPETEWKAHDAPILRLSFSHPLHGSLLASCAHDRTVRIWEEPPSGSSSTAGAAGPKDGRWLDRAVLTGAKGSVREVEFSPPNPGVGLRVASISTDSHLRIHTSLDPDLTDWTVAHDIHVPSLSAPGASEEPAPESGGTAELASGGWGLSWCKEKWWGSVVAAFTGTNPVVKIIQLDPSPSSLLHLSLPSTSAPLTSVAWAPSCGRSYHLIATGARDGVVRIWRIQPPEPGEQGRWTAEMSAEFGKGARINMIDWNATGTNLTTADDEGVIKIYKATYAKEWKLMGKLTAEEPVEETNGAH